MVYDLIAFFTGVYFGFRNSEMERWKLIEKSVPFGIALSIVLNILMLVTLKPDKPVIIEVLVYFFLAFILGSIAGSISGRRLKRAFRVEKTD